jgi:hypothetical protein
MEVNRDRPPGSATLCLPSDTESNQKTISIGAWKLAITNRADLETALLAVKGKSMRTTAGLSHRDRGFPRKRFPIKFPYHVIVTGRGRIFWQSSPLPRSPSSIHHVEPIERLGSTAKVFFT